MNQFLKNHQLNKAEIVVTDESISDWISGSQDTFSSMQYIIQQNLIQILKLFTIICNFWAFQLKYISTYLILEYLFLIERHQFYNISLFFMFLLVIEKSTTIYEICVVFIVKLRSWSTVDPFFDISKS